jgi:hypothetical protein
MNTKRDHGQQRGAAALLVVIVLFLVMAMMAAFANRNMLFEQRIANNYYRASVAMEAAEAGAEWALGMLNGLNIDQACLTAGAVTNSFRERYLNISPSDRSITPTGAAKATVADCIRSELQGWVCNCPTAAWIAPSLVPASAGNMQPSFLVALFSPWGNRAGNIRIESTGCTSSMVSHCLTPSSPSDMGLARSMVQLDAALLSALKVAPATPLTVKGSINLDANGLGLHNSDPRSQGLLLLTADAVVPNLIESRLDTLPGTPSQQALFLGDAELLSNTAEKLFHHFFGMSSARYLQQPALREVSCPADCGPTLAAAYASGVRIAWINGPLNILTNTTLGTDTSPMLIIAGGATRIDAAIQLTGLLYAMSDAVWTNDSAQTALLTGALIVWGDLTIGGTVDIWYQPAVMDQLKNRTGSFVRVQGSWWN